MCFITKQFNIFRETLSKFETQTLIKSPVSLVII